MVRQPQNLNEAKQIFREEKTKVTSSLSAIAGSRWLMAILATFVIAFGMNALYSPSQLPAVGGVSLAAVGLPPNLDFGVVGEQVTQAREAAEREGARERATGLLDENPQVVPILNWAGLALTFAALIGNMWIMTNRRRFTRG